MVEAELGQLGGVEEDVDRQRVPDRSGQAAEFVEKSGCDSLAVAIGTSHGAFKFAGKQGLHFDVLEKIQKALPKNFPLVMHGSSSVPKEWVERINNAGGKMKSTSGVPEEQYLPAAKLGVCKVNIDTDGRLVWCADPPRGVPRRSGQFRPASAGKGLHGRLRRLHRSQEHDARLGRPVGRRAEDAQEVEVVGRRTWCGAVARGCATSFGRSGTRPDESPGRLLPCRCQARGACYLSSSFSGSGGLNSPSCCVCESRTTSSFCSRRPSSFFGEEVVAQAAGPVRQAAQDEHGAGGELGGEGHVVVNPLRPAGVQSHHALLGHPSLPRLVVLQFGHQFQADPAVGLGKRLHRKDALRLV